MRDHDLLQHAECMTRMRLGAPIFLCRARSFVMFASWDTEEALDDFVFTTLRFRALSEHGEWEGQRNIVPVSVEVAIACDERSVPRRSLGDFRYRPEFEKQDCGRRPITEVTAKRVQFEEAEALVVFDGLGLGIDEDADAPEIPSHLVSENEDCAEEHGANTGAVKVLMGRKPGESEHGKRVLR